MIKKILFILLTLISSCSFTPQTRCYSFKYGISVLYVRALYWGNNRLITLSDKEKTIDNISDYDINKELVYKGDFPLYFQLKGDTLYIYGDSIENNSIPLDLVQSTEINIKQINITNYKNMNMMNNKEYIKPVDFTFCSK